MVKVFPQGDLQKKDDPSGGISLAEFHARMAVEHAPSAEEKLRSLRNKYELRLNKPFPANGPSDGTDASIQSWLQTIGFAERRALLMSQKAFEAQYPQGYKSA